MVRCGRWRRCPLYFGLGCGVAARETHRAHRVTPFDAPEIRFRPLLNKTPPPTSRSVWVCSHVRQGSDERPRTAVAKRCASAALWGPPMVEGRCIILRARGVCGMCFIFERVNDWILVGCGSDWVVSRHLGKGWESRIASSGNSLFRDRRKYFIQQFGVIGLWDIYAADYAIPGARPIPSRFFFPVLSVSFSFATVTGALFIVGDSSKFLRLQFLCAGNPRSIDVRSACRRPYWFGAMPAPCLGMPFFWIYA